MGYISKTIKGLIVVFRISTIDSLEIILSTQSTPCPLPNEVIKESIFLCQSFSFYFIALNSNINMDPTM